MGFSYNPLKNMQENCGEPHGTYESVESWDFLPLKFTL